MQNISYDALWQKTLDAVKHTEDDRKLDVSRQPMITKQDKSAGRIEAETNMSLWSLGEIIGVYISPTTNAPSYTVEVESLTKMKTNVFSKNWEDQILENIQRSIRQPATLPEAEPKSSSTSAPPAMLQQVPQKQF